MMYLMACALWGAEGLAEGRALPALQMHAATMRAQVESLCLDLPPLAQECMWAHLLPPGGPLGWVALR